MQRYSLICYQCLQFMSNITEIAKKYSRKIDPLDLELLIASSIKKPREFVLAHPEYKIPATHNSKLEAWIKRRIKHEPIAYILGKKEFFGLDFKVNKHTLIPRPETELIPQLVTQNMEPEGKNKKITIVDIGTGSGNIIISIAKEMEKSKLPITNYQLLAIDISAAALKIAKQNARLHKVDKKIKFIKGNLLSPVICNLQLATEQRIIITANLPYLSKKIYASVNRDIKKYEPRSALLSGKNGLAHYEKLLKQLKTLKNQHSMLHVSCFLEISPEQKSAFQKLSRSLFPRAKITFYKDLAARWRVCRISLQ